MQKRQIEYKGRQYAFQQGGSGALIVLVHGFGEDASIWDRQVPALQGYTLLIPDLPGSGGSELTPDLSMESMAEVLLEMVKSTKYPGKPVLLGHSMGGYVLMAFIEKYPEVPAAIGLIHSTAAADSDERKEKRAEGIRKISKEGAAVFFEGMIPGLFGPQTRHASPQLVQTQVNKAARFSDQASIAYQTAMMQRPDRQEVLKNWRQPVLLVLGAEDTTIPLTAGSKNAVLAQNTSFHVLKSSGHLGMLEEPGNLNGILLDFLRDIL